jgi:malonyl-CoA O-methyltransferase
MLPPYLRGLRRLARERDGIVLCFAAKGIGIRMNDKIGALNKADVMRRFERVAAQFDNADFVHRHTADGLFERLAPMQFSATHILDLGCATGRDRKSLAKRYRRSLVVGLDRSPAMLARAKRKRPWYSKPADVRAVAERLPFVAGSLDLVYANLLLPWLDNLQVCFTEIARVLRKDGLFVFSTLGPDTFREIREAWDSAEVPGHVRSFPDMHDVGDALVQSGLRDPVLDVDTLAVEYRDPDRLFADLTAVAAGNSLRGRRNSLTARARIDRLRKHLTDGGNRLPFTLSLELVYGHAWGGGPPPTAGEYQIAATAIARRRR